MKYSAKTEYCSHLMLLEEGSEENNTEKQNN